ncbi:MAG: hypothetical protein ACR2MU_05960 [Gaiellaceae bacterium]
MAVATAAEERAARRLGKTFRIGLAGANGLPGGRLVSFGLAGALHDGLALGELLDATRIVDLSGTVLWEGKPLGIDGARTGTILAGEAIVDDPTERRQLHERTGADAVDLESGPLAATGRLVGCVRAISDTPSHTLGPLAGAVKRSGSTNWVGLARAFVRAPRAATRAAGDARRALRRLETIA